VFKKREPACPIACKYCFITEDDQRREKLNNATSLWAINNACTYINWSQYTAAKYDTSELARLIKEEWLYDDIIGSTAVTDPFWPRLESYHDQWEEMTRDKARLRTSVTKWPLSRAQIKKIATWPRFHLVLTITGNDTLEKVKHVQHLRTAERLAQAGISFTVLIHPYIWGVSDLSFLKELRRLGIKEVSLKGLRYNSGLDQFIPSDTRQLYQIHKEQEFIPSETALLVQDYGLNLVSLKKKYREISYNYNPQRPKEFHESVVIQMLEVAQIFSSDRASIYNSLLIRRQGL